MRPLYAVAAVLAVTVAAYYGWRLLVGRTGSLSPEALARQALTADGADERQRAAVDLSGAGKAAAPHLRRVLRESNDPAVRAACAQGLGDVRGYEAMDLLLDLLGDEDALVRSRAVKAISRLLRRDLRFPVQGSAADRGKAQAAIRQVWEEIRDSPLLEHIRAAKSLVYYYDRNTGRLFEAPEDSPALIETASGPFRGRPAGALASVFACGDCGDPAQRFVGYLTVPEEVARKHGEKIAGTPPSDEGQVVICRPGEDRWVYLGTPEGEAIAGEAVRRCRGQAPNPCRPGW